MADDSASPSGPEDVVAGPEDVVAGPEDVVAGPEDVVAGYEDIVAGPSKRVEPGSDEERVAGPSVKRIKLSDTESNEPTCVLSLRGLPADITEAEVSAVAQLFGKAVNIILTRNKHKALLEMEELSTAVAMVDRYRNEQLYVRSCQVAVNYSTHTQLTLKVGDGSISMDSSRCVLHVIVDDMKYPLSLDMLTQVFSLHGIVTKIVTFNHNDTFHALVQYADGESAHEGKLKLNGQNVFTGCCKLYIEYSKLQDLVVKYNSEISRDYTNAGLVWNDSPSFSTATVHNKTADEQDATASVDGPKKGLLPIPRIAYPPLSLHHSADALPSKFLSPNTTVMQVTNPFYVGRPAGPAVAPPSSVALPKKVPWSERRPVVLVSNLDEGRVNTDLLFTLFGVYGDVIRVKICCNTKSKALIQYKDYKYARDAIMNLDGINLWGRQLKLTISKYRIVQMPKDGAHNADLTRDYTTSRWHRFHNGDRAQAPVVPPSKTLFLANIPPKVTDTKLKRMFNACGTVVDFKFFEPSNLFRLQQAVQIAQLPANSDRSKERILKSTPDRRMALVELSSVEEGIDALMTLHNKQFPGTNRYLCVSFTASIIEHHDQGGADQGAADQ